MTADLSRSARKLLRQLDRSAEMTKREIGALLGCTPRHAARILDELRAAGVTVSETRKGREKAFGVSAEHQRRMIQVEDLDEEALRALAVAAEASRAVLRGTPLEAPLDRAFAVLLAAYDGENLHSFEPDRLVDQWHFDQASAPGVGPVEILRTLVRAITDQQTVEVEYTNGRGETSTRQLDPLAFAPFPSGWQLAAWCHRRRAVRNFNPARIARVEPLDDYFSLPKDWDADAHFDGRFGALDGDGRLQTVRLRVARRVAQHFKTRPYHASQQVEDAGDELLVSFQVPELKAIRSWVRSWGPAVVALAPPELVVALAEDARATAAHYGELA